MSTLPAARCGVRGAAIALALLAALSAACDPPDAKTSEPTKPKDTSNMPSTQPAVDALSRIPDARLLAAEPDGATDAAYDALRGVTFEGIAVRAPAVVAKDPRSRIPVLVCIAQSAARSSEFPAGDNAVAIVNRVDGAGAWIVPVYPRRPEKIPRPAAGRPPPAPEGGEAAQPVRSTAAQYLDLAAAPGVIWQAGHYALRVISYDWRSNTVPVQIGGGAATAQDEAAREAQRVKWAQAGRGSSESLPHFVRSERSPAVDGVGVAAAFPEPRAASGEPLAVYGTVRLPSKSARTDGPVAVETGHFVLARRGSVEPAVLSLDVPFYTGSSGTMEGYFAYDLAKVAPDPLPPAEYTAYFVLGAHTAGPYKITIR